MRLMKQRWPKGYAWSATLFNQRLLWRTAEKGWRPSRKNGSRYFGIDEMNYQTILYEIKDGAGRLTLNRPEKLNSFNEQMHQEVREVLGKTKTEPVRALLITGAGRGFCAGQDLGDRRIAPGDSSVDLGATIEKYYAPLVRTMRALPIPVFPGVNGGAGGAGANLALACDLVVAAKSACFIESFAKLGLVP